MPESAASGCVTYAAPSGAMSDVPIAADQSPLAKFASITTAAQRLLQDGKILLTTTDGVLIAINEDTIAHIAFDGSVDMLHSANGMIEGFAQNMQGFAEHAEPGIMTRRFILEHAEQHGFDIGCYNPGNYGAPVASSSSDHGTASAIANIREGDAASLYAQALHARIGREQVASDVLTRVRGRSEGVKRVTESCLPIRRSLSEPVLRRVAADVDTHTMTSSDYEWMDFAKNKGFAKQVAKAAVYAVATGGAPSPDDPRNRWNRSRDRVTDKIGNMEEFFKTPFGQSLKGKVQKTNYEYKGQLIYRVTEKVAAATLQRGDLFYLDSLHYDHIEVFSNRGKVKTVLNVDGGINIKKADAAIRTHKPIKI